MIERHLSAFVADEKLGRQMRFIAGPRQAGKTTLARGILASKKSAELYFNWDLREVRESFRSDAGFFETSLRDAAVAGHRPWIGFDEIHKMPRWKDILKSYFDKFEAEARFIVTGSARLDGFRCSGDTLAGRYFLFHLGPLSLEEVSGRAPRLPKKDESGLAYIEARASHIRYEEEGLTQLLEYGGFPEPFLKADGAFSKRWQREMVDRLTRDDVRDLTRILDVENVATLMALLPERVGSPLSLNAVKEDVGVGHTAIRSAVSALQLVYALFLLPPYSHKMARAVKKEKKAYFSDWSRCPNPAKRFENYVACELKSMTDLWHDLGIGDFELNYVRMRDGKETDFLIVRDRVPWILFEAKLEDGPLAGYHFDQARALGGIPLVQVVRGGRVFRKQDPGAFRISASRWFA